MKRISIIGLCFVAVFVASAVAVASASAGGPLWTVNLSKLLTGEKAATVSISNTSFKLDGTTNIVCPKMTDLNGQIFGGDPGTDQSTIMFEECAVEGKTVAECGASNTATAGLVEVNVETSLAYPSGEAGNSTMALDLFGPAGTGETFVEFTLKGTKCALLNNFKVKVKATGEKFEGPLAEKICGVVTEVGEIGGGGFVLTSAGGMATLGALRAPNPAITTAEVWNNVSGKYEAVKCKLEALGAAFELGVADVKLVGGGELGWEV